MEVALQKNSHEKERLMCRCFCLKSQQSPRGFLRWVLQFFALYHSDLCFLGVLTFSKTSLGWQTQPAYFWRRWAGNLGLNRVGPLSQCKKFQGVSSLSNIKLGHQKKCVQSSCFAPKNLKPHWGREVCGGEGEVRVSRGKSHLVHG